MTQKITIGVSACLLGQRVRYNGEIKNIPAIARDMAELVEFVPVCPEVECGLDVPRPPIQLEDDTENPRLRVIESREDLTACMHEWAARRCGELVRHPPDGWLFKARSPSCGLGDVPVFRDEETIGTGDGMFVREIKKNMPDMPLASEAFLDDETAWESFVEAAAARASSSGRSADTAALKKLRNL